MFIPKDNATDRADQRKKIAVFLLIMFIGAGASIMMYWTMNYGPGVSPDSTIYIETARSLTQGNGFTVRGRPMTHYPPGYPLLLSWAGTLQKGDMLRGGRLLGAILFGFNVILFGIAIQISTEHSLLATITAIFFFLSSEPIISLHAMAWSEAPFIFFSLAAFILLIFYIKQPIPYLLISASLMSSFAIATRYVGVTLLPPMALAILLLSEKSMKHRVKDMIIVFIVASLPLAIWLVHNILTAQTATNRTFAVHPFGLNHAKSLISTIYDFVLPVHISVWAKVFHFGIVVSLFVLAVKILQKESDSLRNINPTRIVLPLLGLVFFYTYISFLIISISFFDAHTPLDFRILAPPVLMGTAGAICIAWLVAKQTKQKHIWFSFLLFALLSISINMNGAFSKVIDIHENGLGYTSRYWQRSETMSYLLNLSNTKTIFSNGPDLIKFASDQKTAMIPRKIFPGTRKLNKKYEEQLNQMFLECRKGNAMLVYLNHFSWRWYLPSLKEIKYRGDLPILREFNDGIIFGGQGSKL